MKSPCVSITGATGFIGLRCVDEFLRAGWSVCAVVRPGSAKPLPVAATRREAALQDRDALARAFDGADVVVHAAGLVRAPRSSDFRAINVEGTRQVVEAANAAGTRLVYISSQAAYGPGTAERPSHEDDPPKPVNAYGVSKLAAEAEVSSAARVPWVILRPCAVYGPGDRGFLPLFRMARRGVFPVATEPQMPFTFVFVDDLAIAVRKAAERAQSGDALFIGHGRPETAESMLRLMAVALQRAYRPLRVPGGLVRIAGVIGDWAWSVGITLPIDSARVAEFTAPGFVCDVSRAATRLGFNATVDLAEGLRRSIDWYRDHGWL